MRLTTKPWYLLLLHHGKKNPIQSQPKLFLDKALWNHYLQFVMQLHSDLVQLLFSTNLSLWTLYGHWRASFTKNPPTWSWLPIKNKLSTCSIRWDSLISVQRPEKAVKIKRIKTKVLSLHVSWQRLERVDCVRSELRSVYCFQYWQDSGRYCNFYLLLTWPAVSVIKCQAIKWLNASGRWLWEEVDFLSMSCSGCSVYANVCAPMMLSGIMIK